jgi:hypothetical protein
MAYTPFSPDLAEKYLKHLLKHYRIKVRAWSIGSNGRAWHDSREVKIPRPTDIDRFCIAMHELGHIINNGDKRRMKLYRSEFIAETYAIKQAADFNWDVTEYRERARWYLIMNVAKGHCRKLNLDSIEDDVRDFCQIDFNEWRGKKVFVRRYKDSTLNDIVIQ